MIHLVKAIVDVRPYALTLKFNTGESLRVDLAERLHDWGSEPDSAFKALLDSDYFARVTLDPDLETVCWPNGIDLCPDVLHAMGMAQVDAIVTPSMSRSEG